VISSGADAFSQPVQDWYRVIPGDASVRDTLPVLQASGAVGGNILPPFDDVRLDHYSHDILCGVALFELTSLKALLMSCLNLALDNTHNVFCDFDLFTMLLG
jgi:hypothetical protein